MKTNKTEAIESYFTTESNHFNSHCFMMFCDIIKKDIFQDPKPALLLFSFVDNELPGLWETPCQAADRFYLEMEKYKLNTRQMVFMFDWACRYIKDSEFSDVSEDCDMYATLKILESRKDRLSSELPAVPITTNLREKLKEMMSSELDQLPETLKTLDPVQRLNVLCKLIPFILPKVESVHHDIGERDFRL